MCKYKDINEGIRPWTRLVRVCGGAIYGSFHFIVLHNILDRNLMGQGVPYAVVNCVYLGQQCLSVVVLVFGFSLRAAVAGLRTSKYSPLRSLMLQQCLGSVAVYAAAAVALRARGLGWQVFSAAVVRANAAQHVLGVCWLAWQGRKGYPTPQ